MELVIYPQRVYKEGATMSTKQKLTLFVQGMTCAACSARVEKVLRNLDGVEEANVNLATNRATIIYDPDRLTPSHVIKSIGNAGYEAEFADLVTVEFRVTGMSCSACSARVEKVLQRSPGVHQASVNFATERATIAYDATVTSISALKDVVVGAGYAIEPLQQI
ncbi:MAG TPA: heavy metal translocating P-type ATPase, partial [Firmicutes bacterium]|nr:heavy metal translocating P-type ATPase [Bacillota bacterium]